MEILIQGNKYTLVKENRDGFNAEAFKERYNDILDKYDYIVGDWGYNQLRLRGFYRDEAKVSKDYKISGLEEYLNEYCNFGCAYFVVEKQHVPGQKERSNLEADGEREAQASTPPEREKEARQFKPRSRNHRDRRRQKNQEQKTEQP